MKICPNCKKNVKKSSKKCEFCGFSFDKQNKTSSKNNENKIEVPADVEVLEENLNQTENSEIKQKNKPKSANVQDAETYSQNFIENSGNSSIKRFFINLKYTLSFPPAIFVTLGLTILCVLAIIFFSPSLTSTTDEAFSSAVIMITIFSIFLLIFVICFVLSVIFNILRKRRFKK